jgi:WD40 repeat protein
MAALGGLCPRCVALDFLAPTPHGATEATMPLLEEDERRLGDYELLEEISRGGMGVVYLARQVSLGRKVAVKMILHGALAGDTAIARFKTEATAAAGLSHPNIVAIYEIGEHRGSHFFSMEYVTGRTLAEVVRDGALPARVAANYLERVAAAVHFAHEHAVLHRDLKPSNILIDGEGNPRITDFGLAKRFDAESDLTLTGQLVGTPAYMSPEQAGGASVAGADARSDVYSLGAVLYHTICGLPPFSGESVTEILHKVAGQDPVAPRLLNPGLPRDIETICLKCLAKEPSRRYASALELAEDLARFLDNRPILARPVGKAERIWRWSRRQPALAAALIGCVVILIGGVGGILWQLRQTNAAKSVAVQKARDEEAQRISAQRSELIMRQNLYTADMLAVQRALALNDLGSARMLLNAHRPSAGQEDLRGFEWRYLWRLAQGDQSIVLTNVENATAIAFSPDGKWLAYAGSHIVVYDTASYQVRAVANEHGVDSLSFFPDSSFLVIGGGDSWVRRWDWRSVGQPSDFIDPHATWPRATVSPAGDIVAVGCASDAIASEPDGTTTLYDAATGQPRGTLPESGGHAVFSPDGKLLATGSAQGKVKLWNPETGELVCELTNATRVQSMTFSRDGKTLAVCSPLTDGTWIYDISTGAQRPFARGNFCCVWGAAFSPDGTTLATAVTDETVRLWDLASGRQTACFLGHSYQVGWVAWSPEGNVLASCGADGTARVWDVSAARNAEAPIEGEAQRRLFSRDGKKIAMIEADGAVSIRDLPSLCEAGARRQIGKPLGFLPDSTTLVSTRWPTNGGASEVVFWKTPQLERLKTIALSQASGPEPVQRLSPDGRLLATGASEGEALILDLADNGKLLARFSAPDVGGADALSFSPDSRLLGISFLKSSTGYLWDMKPGHPPVVFKGLIGSTFHFSNDGAMIIANGTNALTYWEAATGKEIARLLGRWGGVDAMDVSPDGKTIAFPARGAVRLWNVATRREVARLETPIQSFEVAFAPSGDSLFISEDGSNGPVTIVKRAPDFEQTDSRF